MSGPTIEPLPTLSIFTFTKTLMLPLSTNTTGTPTPKLWLTLSLALIPLMLCLWSNSTSTPLAIPRPTDTKPFTGTPPNTANKPPKPLSNPWTPPFPITPTGELRPSKRITSEAHGSSGCSKHLVLSLNHSSAQTNENGRCSKSHHTENNNSEKPLH
uniref:Cell wall hydrolase/autolysin n=1 Tax=uncultured marine virus TaxID=186617 RepID=A0A0F7L924_9VIRU|nr:cell wall hydrolase/autolysin [uncultured marine virus]